MSRTPWNKPMAKWLSPAGMVAPKLRTDGSKSAGIIKILFTFSLKHVRKLIEKVMDIVYLPEKNFDNEEKLVIIKVKS